MGLSVICVKTVLRIMYKTTDDKLFVGRGVYTFVVFAAFAVYFLMITGIVPRSFNLRMSDASFPLFYLLWGVMFVAVLVAAHRRNFVNAAGLGRGAARGFARAAICVLPMFIYMFLAGSCSRPGNMLFLFNTAFVAGFFEEFIFRGFLLGQLFRYCRWGFVPASLAAAVFFGVGHVFQGGDAVSAFFAALVTALGSVFFGWLYVESRYNLWFVVFLHVFMNLVWTLFSASVNGVVGSLVPNLFRLLVMAVAVATVVASKKRSGQPYVVNRHTLWRNRQC